MYNDCNWPRNPYGKSYWEYDYCRTSFYEPVRQNANRISDIVTQVSLWTTWTDKPLYLGRGELYHAKRMNLCKQESLCYIIEYIEFTNKGYSELIPFSYGDTTDERLIQLYVNGSLLSPKYGYMRSFTLGVVQFEMIQKPRSYVDEKSVILWRGELDKYMSVWEAQHVARY